MPKQKLPTAAAVDVISLFHGALQSSAVKAGENVVIFCDTFSDPVVADGFLGAAKQLGARPIQLIEPLIEATLSRVENRATTNPVVLSALKQADLVVDITTGGLLYSDLRQEILSSGARILRIREPIETLRRFPFDPEVKRRSLAGAEVLRRGQRCRVQTESGSDFTILRGDRVVDVQYGAADERGRWDHWPTGMVVFAPVEDTLEGRLIIDEGSLLFPPERYVMQPIVLEFKDGKIDSITGGTDAILLKEYMGRSGNPNAFRMAHLGWGTDNRARWEAFSMWGSEGGGGAEARSMSGSVLLAFGENQDLGGQNAAPIHVDICLRQARFEIDNRVIVDQGKIVDQECN